jgi:hypothetical protein
VSLTRPETAIFAYSMQLPDKSKTEHITTQLSGGRYDRNEAKIFIRRSNDLLACLSKRSPTSSRNTKSRNTNLCSRGNRSPTDILQSTPVLRHPATR